MKKNNLILILLFCLSFFAIGSCFAQDDSEVLQEDELYSEAYFDYLIECTKPVITTKVKKEKKEREIRVEEIGAFEEVDEVIVEAYEPFKLKIENNNIGKYTQSFIKEDTKTIIPITSKFSVAQDIYKFKNNTYVTDDVRSLTGIEYKFNKYFKLTSGLETNFRGQEQVPSSRKIYFTPTFELNDKFSIKFHNKYQTQSKETDHDIGLNFSPFESKAVDLGVYAGMTRKTDGSLSESIIFKTSFSF